MNFGGSSVDKLYLGGTDAQKAYLGSALVYQGSEPPDLSTDLKHYWPIQAQPSGDDTLPLVGTVKLEGISGVIYIGSGGPGGVYPHYVQRDDGVGVARAPSAEYDDVYTPWEGDITYSSWFWLDYDNPSDCFETDGSTTTNVWRVRMGMDATGFFLNLRKIDDQTGSTNDFYRPAAGVMPDGTGESGWYHVVLVHCNTTGDWTLYSNGVAVITVTGADPWASAGYVDTDDFKYYDAAGCAIWSRKLTPAEIATLYNSGTPTCPLLETGNLINATTVGAWSLKEIFPDRSGAYWDATNPTAVARVRRSSDSTHTFATATEVTDGTLTTFTGVGDGFTNQLLDQSGNGRLLYSDTAANQPKAVTGGGLETDANGNPALAWNDNTDFLAYDTTVTSAEVTYFVVLDVPEGLEDPGGTQYFELFSENSGAYNDRLVLYALTNGTYQFNLFCGSYTDVTTALRNASFAARGTLLVAVVRNNNTGSLKLRVNGSEIKASAGYTAGSTAVANSIGFYVNLSPGTPPGPVSFWAIANQDLSANIGDIEAAIAARFGITLS